jgi:hypothetical protein
MRTTAASAPPSVKASSPGQRQRRRRVWPGEGASETSSDFALVLTGRRRVVLLEGPRLVREHDRLYAVAQVELLKDVRDVSLDGGLADVELVADLRVRQAASH